MEEIKKSPQNSDVENCLIDFGEKRFEDYSRFRFAEEREWYESALFYQRRQWLRWSDQSRRWTIVKQNPQNPKPMPVSNYFAKTVNANANAFGKVKIAAIPDDDSPRNRRAAQYAEKFPDACDRESGFEYLLPVLSKHRALWGIGVTKDIYDISKSTGKITVPQISLAMDEQGQLQASVGQVQQFSKGRIRTEVRPIFEIFLPRDCQNPNISKCVVQRYRLALSEARRLWPDAAQDLQTETQTEIHQIYLEGLKALVNYSQNQNESQPAVTITEIWIDWDDIPKEEQDKITEQAPQFGFNVEEIQNYGIFFIYSSGKMIDWGPNPLCDDSGMCYKPFTFYLWEADPANVYPKGVAEDLKPLQKRLNRLDSLIELGAMTNAAGKWIWPTTQNGKRPSGSPSEVIEFDPIGDGKIKPEFVQPSPFHPILVKLREEILADFESLGLTEGVSEGDAPEGVDNFRGIAYLGAKADDNRRTQRDLWERAHQLRYEKCLLLAKKYWDEPRKYKVGGFNGKMMTDSIMKQDLDAQFQVEYVIDSSRPKLHSEEQQSFAALIQIPGMIDITDSATRDYILDEAGLENIELANHLQYIAAARALEALKQGQLPQVSPFLDPQIAFKIFSDFTLTEDFDALPPPIQMAIIQGAQMAQMQVQQMQIQQMALQAQMNPNQQGKQLGQAMEKNQQKDSLGKIPGKTSTPQQSQDAALQQGNEFAAQLP